MRKNKGLLSFASMLLSLAIILPGCSSQQNTTENDTGAGNNETNSEQENNGSEETITLRIWDWDEAHMSHMTPYYQETHPNVKFETLMVPAQDYMQKLQSSLASGTDIPDIILGEMSYRGRLFEMGILEDLSQEPYSVKKDDMFDFAVELQSGPEGTLLGVEQQICPAGLAFRRDLAMEYFGTDVPEEIANIIPTWDAFYDEGVRIVQESDGKVHIFPGISVMVTNVLKGQNTFSYIQEDEIDITSRYKTIFDIGIKMHQGNILGNQENDTPALNAGVAAGEFIFMPCPPWGMKWSIESNDPNGSGNWGLVKAPESGFTAGGTSVSIYSDSPNKEAAWEYIQFTYIDGAGVEEAYKQFGFMTGFKAPYENENSYFFTEEGAYDEYFGGQKMADYYINTISVETTGQIQTKNEVLVLEALSTVMAQVANDKTMTSERALELLIAEVEKSVPDVTVK